MGNKIVNDIKQTYYCLIDEHGNWREVPIGIVHSSRCSEESIELMKIIITIIVNSNNISDETKLFIIHKGLNIKETNEMINDLREAASDICKKRLKPLSYSNTMLKISRDSEQISTIIGERFFRDLYYNKVPTGRERTKFLNKLIQAYGDCDSIRENLLINMNSNKIAKNEYCKNSKFFDKLYTLKPYLVQQMREVEIDINKDKEFIEYFNYLLNKASITDKEVQSDREKLFKFLSKKADKTEINVEQDITSKLAEDKNNKPKVSKKENKVSKEDTTVIENNIAITEENNTDKETELTEEELASLVNDVTL